MTTHEREVRKAARQHQAALEHLFTAVSILKIRWQAGDHSEAAMERMFRAQVYAERAWAKYIDLLGDGGQSMSR